MLILRCTNFGLFLQATGNTKIILRGLVISLILNFVLAIGLLYVVGFPSPAIASLIATAWNAVYMLYHVSKVTKLGIKGCSLGKKLLQITAVNVILGVVFFVIKTFAPLESYIFLRRSIRICRFLACYISSYIQKTYKRKIKCYKKSKTLNSF